MQMCVKFTAPIISDDNIIIIFFLSSRKRPIFNRTFPRLGVLHDSLNVVRKPCQTFATDAFKAAVTRR